MSGHARTAVIGDKDVAEVFGALGFEVFPFTREYKVRETIKELAAKNYTLVLITESCAAGVSDYLTGFTAQPYPIFLTIPDGVTAKGLGHAKIDANNKKVSLRGGNK